MDPRVKPEGDKSSMFDSLVKRAGKAARGSAPYSTVTLFARLRGWSTSVPFITAV